MLLKWLQLCPLFAVPMAASLVAIAFVVAATVDTAVSVKVTM
jgi:hypothetical protein